MRNIIHIIYIAYVGVPRINFKEKFEFTVNNSVLVKSEMIYVASESISSRYCLLSKEL